MGPAVSRNLKRRFAQALDVPQCGSDRRDPHPRDGEVQISNHKGLVQYTTAMVKLRSVEGFIEVSGSELEIAAFSAQEIKIRGESARWC